MNSHSIQDYLFLRIKEQIGADASLVDVISRQLFISPDSAYRRIRGETLLVLDEAKVLCDNFNISLDHLLKSEPKTIFFHSVEVKSGPDSFRQFLLGILKQLQAVAEADDSQLIYLSKELVMFHKFLYKPLFAFQYLFWMKSILSNTSLSLQYSQDVISSELEEITYEILSLYYKISTTEILNTESINSTIAQIEYYRDAGAFKTEEDVEQVYNSLKELIEHLHLQAELGSKFLPHENASLKKKNYQLYYNRIGIADNTILVKMHGKKMVFLNYDTLDYMYTTDEKFCNKIECKLQMMIRRGTLLSDFNGKQRDMFFNTLLAKIPKRTKTIK